MFADCGGDEMTDESRKAFEARFSHLDLSKKDASGWYEDWTTQFRWKGWSARDAAAAPCRWRGAVIDALVVGHIYNASHDADPRKAINDLICWETDIALDPQVSSAAEELVASGRREREVEVAALKARVEELQREASSMAEHRVPGDAGSIPVTRSNDQVE